MTDALRRNGPWVELQTLAIRYQSLPPRPAPDAPDAAREALGRQILGLLANTWVQMLGTENDPRAHRHDSELEKLFRSEARKLARRYGNESLVRQFGGETNLAANAQQEYFDDRLARFGARQQTLLSGMLATYDPGKGSLRDFMRQVVSNFLLDMHRRHFGSGKVRQSQAGEVVRSRRKGSKPPLEAMPPEWELAPKDESSPDWLAGQSREQQASPEQMRQQAEDDQGEALQRAAQALPPELHGVYRMELLKQSGGLKREQISDAELARRLNIVEARYVELRQLLWARIAGLFEERPSS